MKLHGGPVCCCELNSSGSHPVVSGPLHALDSPSSSLRPLCVLRLLNGQYLGVTPRGASILIIEWISLWDHYTE